MFTLKFSHLVLLAVSGLVIGLFGMMLFSFWDRIVYALTPRPETFTELYFEDHLNLPRRVEFNTPFTVTYTVHSLENQPKDYIARVMVEYEGLYPLVYQDSEIKFTLQHDETKTIPVVLTLPEIFAYRAKVTILLVELNQTIHFWVDVPHLQPKPSPTLSPSPTPPGVFPE